MVKEKTNKDLFEEAEELSEEELETAKIVVETEDEMVDKPEIDESDLIVDDFKPIISEKSQQEIEEESGVKKEMDGKILTIESVEILPPKIRKKDEQGNIVKIEPSLTKTNGNPYYSTKVKIRFKEENIVEYYPTIRVWVNDGKLNPLVRLDRTSHNKVAQMVRLALQKMSNNAFKLTEAIVNERTTTVVTADTEDQFKAFSKVTSDQEILNWMIGKKVKVKTSKGNYEGKNWYRNDIVAFQN